MNWKLILSLASFGFVMGVASLFGYTHGIELYQWLAIAVVTVYVLVKEQARNFSFAHGSLEF